MQTVILIRHGYPSSWDEKLKARGVPAHERLDSGLADIGKQQARLSAEHLLTSGGVDVVISSPFRRCLETADAIATVCKAEIAPDWRVGEVLLSQVLGSPFSPTSAMDPAWSSRREGAGKPAHPESDRTIQERVAKFVTDLKSRKPLAQRIVVISHDIILKELFKLMNGRAPTVDWHPCAITILTRAKPNDRQWKLVGGLAGHQHLGSDDRSEPVEQIVHRYHPMDSRS
jgi:broad specificity phosphatase PhoE